MEAFTALTVAPLLTSSTHRLAWPLLTEEEKKRSGRTGSSWGEGREGVSDVNFRGGELRETAKTQSKRGGPQGFERKQAMHDQATKNIAGTPKPENALPSPNSALRAFSFARERRVNLFASLSKRQLHDVHTHTNGAVLRRNAAKTALTAVKSAHTWQESSHTASHLEALCSGVLSSLSLESTSAPFTSNARAML